MLKHRRSAARLGMASGALVMAAQLAAAHAWARTADAQQGGVAPDAAAAGTIVGVVRDEAGNGVAWVEVSALGGGVRAVSDASGGFILRRVPVGADSIRFRRLGFQPRVVASLVSAELPEPLDVVLTPLPMRLAAVAVRASRPHYSGYMADFYRRRDAGGSGSFFTRAQIDSMRPGRTTDLLRRLAGWHFSRPGAQQTVVQGREGRCTPLVWIDGMPAASAYFDPDNVNVNDIAGLEVYTGMANVPTALLGPRAAGLCGAIGIWTRDGEPRPKKSKDQKEAARHLAALVDSVEVYTAGQVDVAAALDPGQPFAPEYPNELRKLALAGVVVAEFVVNADGRADPATFSVVSSSNALFTAAVDSALPTASFRPATLGGRPVRQVVQLPVYFLPPRAAAGAPSPAPAARPPEGNHGGVACATCG